MPIHDDGDLVRGLGFVVLYAAHLEDSIADVVDVFLNQDPDADFRLRNYSSGQHLGYIKKQLTQLTPLSGELSTFPAHIDLVCYLLQQRHLAIHGRIFNVPGVGDILRPARQGYAEVRASSAEMYSLANDLFAARNELNHAS